MKKLFIIGENLQWARKINSSCFTYDMKRNERIKIANLNQSRSSAACKTFEGKIIVTGGVLRSNSCQLKSVAYDYYQNKGTYLRYMIDKKDDHTAVSIGIKLFIFREMHFSSCEVFDSCSRKFTIINLEMKVLALEINYFKAYCIGSKNLTILIV